MIDDEAVTSSGGVSAARAVDRQNGHKAVSAASVGRSHSGSLRYKAESRAESTGVGYVGNAQISQWQFGVWQLLVA